MSNIISDSVTRKEILTSAMVITVMDEVQKEANRK